MSDMDASRKFVASMSTLLERAREDSSGATAVIFGMTLFAVVAASALAMNTGDMFGVRSKTQSALDSAVLAGASAPYDLTDEQRIAVAQQVYTSNMTARAVGAANLNVVQEQGATFLVTSKAVEGTIDFTMRAPFLRVFGQESVRMKVTSAARRAFGAPACVIGLDPTEAATMDFNGQASLDVHDCATQANSSNSSGLHQAGSPTMSAKEIGVTGNYEGTGYSPPPVAGTQPLPDPLASLPAPAPGPCHPMSGKKLQQDTVTLTPGTYCNGLDIKASSVVTLQPGEYIFKDGPLTIDSQSRVSGSEVLLAFLGPTATLYMLGGAVLDVTSPTSGTYMNIQFFGDRTAYPGPGANGTNGPNLWFTVIGDSQLTYDGTLYAPSFDVWFAGGSLVEAKSPNYLAIAKKLWFQDHTQVKMAKENTRSLNVPDAINLRYGATMYK